ncbi:opsin, blue-sensitive-like [Ornithodoros turicata]|uniref:opsin, blue-sensitive-like n=1 Tax=Ornithodoros turicata TaxID=34597 RepID=UPI00313A1BCD
MSDAHNLSSRWETLVDEELLSVVPAHWLSFPPPSPEAHMALAAVYFVLFVAGFLGNTSLIYLFLTTRALRTSSNLLVFNLALSDLLMDLEIPLLVYNSLRQRPALGIWGCRLYGFMGGVSGTSAILSITGLALDRCCVIWHPFCTSPVDTFSRRSLVLAITTWIYATVFSVCPLFGLNRYVPEGFLTSCSFDFLSTAPRDRNFVWAFFVAAWCVPVATITGSYAAILVAMRRSGQESTCGDNSNNKHRRHIQRASELRVARVALLLLGLWMVAWTPYAVVALLGITGQRRWLTPLGSMLPAVFCKSAAVLDPFVYGLNSPRFRRELNKRLYCVRCQTLPSGPGEKHHSSDRASDAVVTAFMQRLSSTKNLCRPPRVACSEV